ncbi:hypothetical protein CAAN1_04S06326 [[Candida] anglica]|uniref:Uncharacterized protein n=1 Tax=[Candida] anglica TaxID=148631 RepID=A0ABP0EBE5_9ASCO
MLSVPDFQAIAHNFSNASSTPYPAWALGGLLLGRGLTIQKPMTPISGTSGSSFKFSQTLATARPTKASCFTFGAAHLLGGWIIYDGDELNGAGFNFAWSTLYLIVNGRAGIKSIFAGRINPLAFSLLALGNAGIYGKRFFWP